MPSPIAHAAAGYAIYRLYRPFLPDRNQRIGSVPLLLVITVAFSFLPDIDSVLGLLAGNFGRYHNNVTHSLFVGAAIALVSGAALTWKARGTFAAWFFLIWLAYGMHILMDVATIGRGVMALWPLTGQRFLLPVSLFYGFHWSDGLMSSRHLWTSATELVFAVVVIWWARRRPGIAERRV